jgi:hypothetical protein
LPAPERIAPVVVTASEPLSPSPSGAAAGAETSRSRPPAVQYLDFRTTAQGREYLLRALGSEEPRLFVLLIPDEAFASRAIRFQDGPDLCFRHLMRELTADPDLLPSQSMLVSAAEIGEYRAGREQPTQERRGRKART